jgi:hypothetical protein
MPRGIYKRTEKHGRNISLAKKGKRTSTATEFRANHGRIRSLESYGNAEYRKKLSNSKKGKHTKKWNSLSYSGKHHRIRAIYGKANKCESEKCNGKSCVYEWANKTNLYLKNRKDWLMLCKSCHKIYDSK